jgi:hypothetical protein
MNNSLLSRARASWGAAFALRNRRLRYKRYTFGKQWLDECTLDNGAICKEHDYLIQNGYTPVTNNIILQLVRTIIGCFRDSITSDSPLAATVNVDAATFQEFLVSGCAIQRLYYASDGTVKARMISPARFFINSLTTPDGSDADLMGELLDFTLNALIERFSHGDAGRMAMLRSVFTKYAADTSPEALLPQVGESADDNLSFDSSSRAATLRVIEVWSHECRRVIRVHDPADGTLSVLPIDDEKRLRATNRRRERRGEPLLELRHSIDARWVCRFLTTDGRTLDTIVAQRHPYALCFYPMIDGEIHSFVEDIIDQQHNINWLMTLNNRLLSQAAKGVVLFPETQFSKQMPADMVAEKLREPDGIVLYRPEPGVPGPQQVMTSVNAVGIQQMLDTQLRMMREVSGVGDALRGQVPTSVTSASLYQSQQQGQLLTLRDLLDTFSDYLSRRQQLLAQYSSTL